jgi:hypothetical protein
MPSAPYDLSISAARAGALFAPPLRRSGEPSARQVRRAIATAIGVHGVRDCAVQVAQAYGEHPETALSCAGPGRRWARSWTIRSEPAPGRAARPSGR